MNNEIQRFDFKGASLRTLTDEEGEPWFIAKDVCDILGMSNPSMAVIALDKDEVAQIDPKDYLGSEIEVIKQSTSSPSLACTSSSCARGSRRRRSSNVG